MVSKRAARKRRWWVSFTALLALFAMLWWAWNWWTMRSFTPDLAIYSEQGALLDGEAGDVRFQSLDALGAAFVYLVASSGASVKDERFGDYYTAAQQAGLKVGALHNFDPCERADGQSANFVTMVPRDTEMLPPAIALERTGADCKGQVNDAAVESELMILINQIEMHSGKPVILKLMPRFEKRYRISARVERGLWLVRDRFVPEYGGRPWLLWSANRAFENAASPAPIEWVVVQP